MFILLLLSRYTMYHGSLYLFFFFNDTTTTEIYTLSLHDALPIWRTSRRSRQAGPTVRPPRTSSSPTRSRPPRCRPAPRRADRKSTRLNSSHSSISYAVFCLKKKKQITEPKSDETIKSTMAYHKQR